MINGSKMQSKQKIREMQSPESIDLTSATKNLTFKNLIVRKMENIEYQSLRAGWLVSWLFLADHGKWLSWRSRNLRLDSSYDV